ncbi:MAG TPA: hypothetical protein VG368_02150 [Acidimicrobiales bacterium]|nr:hypothetical protein [Acidimicrobiales bacterium]
MTRVLLLPDLFILIQAAPVEAVFVLVLMHLSITFVTYISLVNIGGSGSPRRAALTGRRRLRVTAMSPSSRD